MEDDTPQADETARRVAHDGPDRIPAHVPDRFEKTVRDDHATNAALHAALRTDDDFASVNLMGSHAPGEKDQRPRYHVRITVENAAMGEPSTGPTVIDELVERDDVRILKAYGGARYDDVTVEDETGRGNDATPDDVVDAVEGTIEGAVDYITVHVRPVEKTVEPVTITSNDLPREYVDIGDVEHTAARTLRKVIDEHGVDSDRAHEAARSLATVVAVHVDPDDTDRDVYDRIWSTAGADPAAVDVVCPECSNHFGFDVTDEDDFETVGDEYSIDRQVFDLSTPKYPDVAENTRETIRALDDETKGNGARIGSVLHESIDGTRTSAVLWELYRMYATGEVYGPDAYTVRETDRPDDEAGAGE